MEGRKANASDKLCNNSGLPCYAHLAWKQPHWTKGSMPYKICVGLDVTCTYLQLVAIVLSTVLFSTKNQEAQWKHGTTTRKPN